MIKRCALSLLGWVHSAVSANGGFLEDLKDLISTENQNFKQSYEKNEQYLCPNVNLAHLCFKHPLEVKLDHQNIC